MSDNTTNYVSGKSIVITGGGSGFGKLIALKAGALGASVTLGDIDEAGARSAADEVTQLGGQARGLSANVAVLADMQALVAAAVSAYGKVDVLVNNAGIMPLAHFADHARAIDAWNRCIDINIRGTMNGIVAVHDFMIEQGFGHVVNVSSIYGNAPLAGGAIYGASKAAVNYMGESLRIETRGKIKVTTIKPTGVSTTNIHGAIINPAAGVHAFGVNVPEFMEVRQQVAAGTLPDERRDPEHMDYFSLASGFIADAVIHAINQPLGVSISEMTVRAAGDYFVV